MRSARSTDPQAPARSPAELRPTYHASGARSGQHQRGPQRHRASTSGKTPGMTLLGVRAVGHDGSDVSTRHGLVRTLVFPLSFLLPGLRFLGILFGRDRRAARQHRRMPGLGRWSRRRQDLRPLDRHRAGTMVTERACGALPPDRSMGRKEITRGLGKPRAGPCAGPSPGSPDCRGPVR